MKNLRNNVSVLVVWFSVFLLAGWQIIGCKKERSGKEIAQPCTLSYGDSIFYLNDKSSSLIIRPLLNPANIQGSYSASPDGLVIDPVTGAVNLSQSETGIKYTIKFTNSNGRDTCKTSFVLSGIDYKDSVYVMTDKPNAFPIYNAHKDEKGPCVDTTGIHPNYYCKYDDPPSGQPKVTDQGMAINQFLGIIDLNKTIQNGALGANPANGATKDFTIYYRLYDKSERALNHITVRLYYYDTMKDIPPSLLDEIQQKKQLNLYGRLQAAYNPFARVALIKPRPPIIIIVSR